MKHKSIFREAGLKRTDGRETVLQVIDESDAPLSAKQIWEGVLSVKKNIGFATVYRTLSKLCEIEAIRKVPAEGCALYERLPAEGVPQIICSRCGKMEEIHDPALIVYNETVLKSRGLAENDPLLIYASCKKKECDDI